MMALFSRLIMLVLVLAVSPAWAHPIWTNEPSGMTASKACQALKTCTAKDLSKKLDAELKKVKP